MLISPVVRAGTGGALPRSAGSVDGETHRARGALDDPHGVVDVVGVEVLHLQLRDLTHLVTRDLADLVTVGDGRSLLHPGRLLEQVVGGGSLRDEGEGAVFE